MRPALGRYAAIAPMRALATRVMADCALTSLGITPLNELGLNAYSNSPAQRSVHAGAPKAISYQFLQRVGSPSPAPL
jgi:hypothetical protein